MGLASVCVDMMIILCDILIVNTQCEKAMVQKPLKILNVRISPELDDAMQDYRWRHRMSQSDAIRHLIQWALDHEPEPSKAPRIGTLKGVTKVIRGNQ